MSEAIITVDSLGKKYSIRHQRDQRYTALRDVLAEKAKSLFRRPINLVSDDGSTAPAAREDFWALKNVSFEVKQGEVVGIIGRNGAGKSTLLKILSRITAPTEGRVRIKGRVASLLEVGTGFHPELTGRENIFLNGAVLGMGREEITRKFDEIVAFAETEKFLDTPVKRYSSGMYVRLAFAVAAHLEPEILVVDEVLAVGDTEFQKKCLGKMGDVAKGGRTVLFVSHNMDAITRLCGHAFLLERGTLAFKGKSPLVVKRYLTESGSIDVTNDRGVAQKHGPFMVRRIRLLNQNRMEATQIIWEETFTVEIEYDVVEEAHNCMIWVAVRNSDNQPIICTSDLDYSDVSLSIRRPGRKISSVTFPARTINVGYYQLVVGFQSMSPPESYYRQQDISFVIDHGGANVSTEFSERGGMFKMLIPWKTKCFSLAH